MIQQSGGQKKRRKHAGYKHVFSKNENNVHGDLGEKQAKKRPMIQITIFSPVLERVSKDTVATGYYRLRYWKSKNSLKSVLALGNFYLSKKVVHRKSE